MGLACSAFRDFSCSCAVTAHDVNRLFATAFAAVDNEPAIGRPARMLIVAFRSDLSVVAAIGVDEVYLKTVAVLAAIGNFIPLWRPSWPDIITSGSCYSLLIAAIKRHDKNLRFAEAI